MAETFLFELLTSEEVLDYGDNDRCFVCLQNYGSLTDAGAMEREIRLPCNHSLGSMCISIWLKSNNTCPICRKELFPDQSHTNFQEDLVDGEIPNPPVAIPNPPVAVPLVSFDPDLIGEVVRDCCDSFGLAEHVFYDAFRIFQPMYETVKVWLRATGLSRHVIACITMYIILYLLGYPRSLLDFSSKLLINEVDIRDFRSCYAVMYHRRESLIDPSMLEVLGRGNMEYNLDCLPRPDFDEAAFGVQSEVTSRPVNAATLRMSCEQICQALRNGYLIVGLLKHLAETIHESSYLDVPSCDSIVSVALFMAFHLVGTRKSYKQVHEITGVAVAIIRRTYHQLFPNRRYLVKSASLEYIYRCDKSMALRGVLATLSWPPLRPASPGRVQQDRNQGDDHLQAYRRDCESFCASLGVDARVTDLTYRFVVRYSSEQWVVGSPLLLTAASICIATQMAEVVVTFDDISAVVGLHRDVIEALYKALAAHEDGIIINEVWNEFLNSRYGGLLNF